MKREFAIETIRQNEAALRALGVTRLDLFGSVARDEADGSSDIDIVADFNTPGLQGLAFLERWEEIRRMLVEALRTDVDVVPYPLEEMSSMRAAIERDVVAVF